MKISKEEIEHIANLASLNLSSEEIEEYEKDMAGILDFANIVNKLDTDGIEESARAIEQYNVFREDEVKVFEDMDLLLENAPEHENNMFKVPKVV